MGRIFHRNPDEIRERALEQAAKKYQEGCDGCVTSYLELARQHGATEQQIEQALARAAMSRRKLLRFAGAAVAAGIAGTVLSPVGASAAPFFKHEDQDVGPVPGFFGTDSCTSLKAATAAGMPLNFYIGELGGTHNSLDCFDIDSAQRVGPAFTHSYWGVCGPTYANGDPSQYGDQQAGLAVDAWNRSLYAGARTIFADVEAGFGGWGTGATPAQNAALLDAWLKRITAEGFIPGVYINNSNKRDWFPTGYVAATPFVYWVAGGKKAGSMCAPCQSHCDTLRPTFSAWMSTTQNETFGGMAAALWQYWLSELGCAGDFNYSPQPAYTQFHPVTVEQLKAGTQPGANGVPTDATPTPGATPTTTPTP
ncbi:MAG TPA: carboxymuconolactone decarboxylase family protein [Ktedonobacterales bacterium]